MNKHVYSVLPIILSMAVVVLAWFVFAQPQPAQGVGYGPQLGTATTTAVTSVTASTRVLATTTNPTDPTNNFTRQYATICNPSSTVVYINMNGDKPATASGGATAMIAAAAGYDTCFEITDRNMYSGSVQASSTVGAVNIYTQQFVY